MGVRREVGLSVDELRWAPPTAVSRLGRLRRLACSALVVAVACTALPGAALAAKKPPAHPTPTPRAHRPPARPSPTPHVRKPPPTATPKPPPPDACKSFRGAGMAPQGHNLWGKPPRVVVSIHRGYTATLKTTKGSITISLAASTDPITVNNFLFLSCNGFYNGTIFHRVTPGILIQGGDPTGTGTGGPGYVFKNEPVHGSYVRGVVAMGNYGPNTNGSQFFILLAPIVLPPTYTIFGRVVAGMAVADAIANVPTTKQPDAAENTRPVHPDHISSVRVTSP